MDYSDSFYKKLEWENKGIETIHVSFNHFISDLESKIRKPITTCYFIICLQIQNQKTNNRLCFRCFDFVLTLKIEHEKIGYLLSPILSFNISDLL